MTQPDSSTNLPDSPAVVGVVDTLIEETLGALNGRSNNGELEYALTLFAIRAATLNPVRSVIARAAALVCLKELGIDAPAKLIDRALAMAALPESTENGSGSVVLLKDVEPWPEEVDGFAVADEVMAMLLRYVSMSQKSALAVALWVMLTHAHDAFHVSPLLAITSPQKRCGKTTLLHLIQGLARRPLPGANIPAASLFRAVEKFQPTLLVDEADTFLKDNDDLRGVLNSGHVRASAQVIRSVGDDFEPRVFSTWAPKAIALIGRLPDTLEDRSIVIAMRRRASGETIERLRLDRIYEALEPLRQKLARWATDHLEALRYADPEIPAGLHDRAVDNWSPLLAIADQVAAGLGQMAREAAAVVSGGAADDDAPPAELLLGDIRRLFDESGTDRLTSENIVESLVVMEDRPWPEWRRGRPLSKRGLARLLQPFGVRPKKVRVGDTTAQGYSRERFTDAFARYLPPLEVEQPEQASKNGGFDGFPKWNTTPSVPDAKTGETLGKMGDVPDVPVVDPPSSAQRGSGPGLEPSDDAFWNGLAVEGAG